MNIFLSQEPSNKRKFPRVPFKGTVHFFERESKTMGGCLACDISEGGIRVNFNDFVPLNSEVNLNLQIDSSPNPKIVDLTGRVAWIQQVPYSDRYQVGFEFIEADHKINSIKQINQYIHSIVF